VWSHGAKLTFAQLATEAKSNEISAIPELWELISLKSTVVTIDPMRTQCEIAELIVDGNGDYVLPAKGNQPSLEAGVKAEFDTALEEGLPGRKVSVIETEETAHGRKGKRTYLLMNVPKWGDWKGLKTLGMAVRGHWGIENTCRWSLDITFREDEKRPRLSHAPENEAWLRRFVQGILNQHHNDKLSVAMKRRKAGWDENFFTEVVLDITT